MSTLVAETATWNTQVCSRLGGDAVLKTTSESALNDSSEMVPGLDPVDQAREHVRTLHIQRDVVAMVQVLVIGHCQPQSHAHTPCKVI